MSTTLKLATFTLFALIHFTSCQKKSVTPPKEESNCKITAFTFQQGSATFNYNSFGNPTSVLFSNVGTGNPHGLFRYDIYNRLTDYIGSYSGATDPNNLPPTMVFEYWNRFVYADNNPASMPIRDTTRAIGLYINGAFGQVSQIRTNDYSYDTQGRITQIDTREGAFGMSKVNYVYDANGNLILPNVTYDMKRNYRTTSKVLMLIDRNYSVNNPFVATTYNAEGYPTTFPVPPASQFYLDNFLRRGVNLKTMDYSCSGAAKSE